MILFEIARMFEITENRKNNLIGGLVRAEI